MIDCTGSEETVCSLIINELLAEVADSEIHLWSKRLTAASHFCNAKTTEHADSEGWEGSLLRLFACCSPVAKGRLSSAISFWWSPLFNVNFLLLKVNNLLCLAGGKDNPVKHCKSHPSTLHFSSYIHEPCTSACSPTVTHFIPLAAGSTQTVLRQTPSPKAAVPEDAALSQSSWPQFPPPPATTTLLQIPLHSPASQREWFSFYPLWF